MKTNIITFIVIAMAVISCNGNQKTKTPPKQDTIDQLTNENQPINTVNTQPTTDSLFLKKYECKIKKEFVENAKTLTEEQLDSIFNETFPRIIDTKITYSPDSTFKIFTFTMEDCGARCNVFYYSWLHFNLKKQEKAQRLETQFKAIDSIYKIEENKFLIVDREVGAQHDVTCLSASLISFAQNNIKIQTVKRKLNKDLSFCDQENETPNEKEPFIKYDSKKKRLIYSFRSYNLKQDGIADTVWQGQMKYLGNNFVLEKETFRIATPGNQ
ncbi:hypothetical protein [Pedobacter sp.]|uniref:hypothetical protein n=1 Tax=Pedobacter sp. TaxID=1411316 RepID=UPI0031DAB6DC